jgi:protein-S-isoprenylcysteine O-methyltransferase Ste14
MKPLNTVSGPEESPSSILLYVFIPFTLLVGCASLILTTIFLYWGPLKLVSPGLDETSALLLNTFLSLGFFVQHSGMTRRSFRRWASQFIEEKYQGALYTISSSVLLILIAVFWQQSSYTLVSAQGALRWLLRGVFYLSCAGIVWGLWSLDKFDAFGLDSLRNPVHGATAAQTRLLVRGPYRWVRHPLYFFCLLMIWFCPDLTADRLLFNILWTGWIVVGTVLEERDLAESFGGEYRSYQRQVPMLLPNSFRPTHWQDPILLPWEVKKGGRYGFPAEMTEHNSE